MKQLVKLDAHKKTAELYLRALWGRGFVITGVEVDDLAAAPLSYLENETIYIPGRVLVNNMRQQYYRAAAAHAALHVISGDGQFDRDDLNHLQRTVVGLVEDLRLELHAIKHFPGLRNLWLKFHNIENTRQVSAWRLMLRLSRCVLDPMYKDDHQWVQKGKQRILEGVADNNDPAISLDVGLSLANDLGQMRLPINSGKYEQPVTYRDDNRCLWKKELELRRNSDSSTGQAYRETQSSKFIESNQGIELKITDLGSGLDEYGFDITVDTGEDLEYQQSLSPDQNISRTYPEWDYRIQILKQDWCRIQEYTCKPGSMAVIEEITDRHKYTLNRLQGMANRLRMVKQQWMHKLEDGDDFDLVHMVDTVVSIRAKKELDLRVFMRKAKYQEKKLAISILLDLSESTNETIDDGSQTISQVLRDAVLLLAETLSVSGDRFSISGFSSDGRLHVNYVRFKSFDEDYESHKNRLSEITGKYSTRLGAAIRHSAGELARQPERKKLLLLITDGVPSDIDVYDKNYLIQDSWYAIQDLKRYGIRPFCINLDRSADRITEHIFGYGRSETLDNVVRLPDLLAHLYMRYMHT